ncbi:MAG TPA: DNA repair protein RadC [Aquifex aeolicus]|nr:DNA repair protein RadC [Aquificales bacterium]HIQ25840.1 DNA repair protein RadC [Aquifex aeolicus]
MYKPKGKSLKDLPKGLLPREKLEKLGAENLAEEELWAIILGSGTRGFSVIDIGARLASLGFENLAKLPLEELSKIPGVGRVKALTVKAVTELCKRNRNGENLKITHPLQVVKLVSPLLKGKKEKLFVLTLSAGQRLLGLDLVAVGSLNTVYAPPREVLQPVISRGGYLFILVHNHPDGEAQPSKEDITFTKRIEEGANLLGLELLDHIIIADDHYFSFKENRMF